MVVVEVEEEGPARGHSWLKQYDIADEPQDCKLLGRQYAEALKVVDGH